ncbi:6-phospho-beta-glucosidase [Anaerobranca gottschalkii]|uniref:6-phospho-beta-glucosidase n=1 Tax=Anaerobranca gottschalkii DSM 13577 TaxID=1120990 RepID=A0A1I0AP18_9FIRM|nr:6-phospho-beta-glucosidase [Anaerobranca gottschalkii]SES95664.1 6-phospho-beta-glucosidase [Anaerobranca gottschalkii DSM 13577]
MNKLLKIAVIGGGSSYTPEIIEGFIKRANELPVKEIWLVDIKEGEEKLNIVGKLAQRMIEKAKLDTKVFLTLNRREALKDADFVITQFRVGGLEARLRDEEFPLKYGVIGQETTGPGGFAKALRTIPVILDICKDIEELAPRAWLINFTNPAGIITETISKYTKVKTIGLCNVPITMEMTISKLLEVDKKDIFVEFIGLNHLVWGKRVLLRGEDITERIIKTMLDGSQLNMKNIPDLKWDREFVKNLGMIPCPYHRYYYMSDLLLKEQQSSLSQKGKGSRAQQVMEIEKKLFEIYKDENLDEKPKELEKRGGAYYSDAAVSLISAIYNDKKEIHVVNVKNNGTISFLPDDAIIETNCVVGNNGAVPLIFGDVPKEIVGLINQVKIYESLAIEAGVTGDKDKAVMALVNHPLVLSVEKARKLVDELLNINKQYLPQFK